MGPAVKLALAALVALACAPSHASEGRLPKSEGAGWLQAPAGLLRFDDRGDLVQEIGLGLWTQPLGGERFSRRTAQGGVSSDGRFAWHWEKIETLRRRRVDEVLASTRSLAYFGTDGQVLWSDPAADAPEGTAPVIQSAGGETALVIRRSTAGWSAAAIAFTGNRLIEVSLGERLESAELTSNGRFAHLAWGLRDEPLIHPFFDLRTGDRADVPAVDTELGRAGVGNDGVVRSGDRVLHRFGLDPAPGSGGP